MVQFVNNSFEIKIKQIKINVIKIITFIFINTTFVIKIPLVLLKSGVYSVDARYFFI